MTVYRWDGSNWVEVSTIGRPTDDATIKVRRADSWDVIWGIEIDVQTSEASSISGSLATLNGELTQFVGDGSVNGLFRWRPAGEEPIEETSKQELSTTSSFSESVSGLESGLEYEFRAVVEIGSDEYAGQIRSFTT